MMEAWFAIRTLHLCWTWWGYRIDHEPLSHHRCKLVHSKHCQYIPCWARDGERVQIENHQSHVLSMYHYGYICTSCHHVILLVQLGWNKESIHIPWKKAKEVNDWDSIQWNGKVWRLAILPFSTTVMQPVRCCISPFWLVLSHGQTVISTYVIYTGINML